MEEKIQEQIDEQLKTARQARVLDDGETSAAPVLDTAMLELSLIHISEPTRPY